MTYLANSKEYLLKQRINLWVVFSAVLVLSNGLLALLCWYAIGHQKIEVTPFFGHQGYLKSDSEVDTHYLDQMADNFILARLNVTPSNIKANHARLLNYVDSRYYHTFSAVLLREQRQVIDKKISSYFDRDTLKSIPEELKTRITGHLRRFVGTKELAPSTATYELHYAYHLGRLSIISFKKIGEHHDD